MSIRHEEWGLANKDEWITPQSRSFRPPRWPPPSDWPVAEDRDGNSVAVWADSMWPLAGKRLKLNFGDGPTCRTDRIDRANADLLRLAIGYRMWGPRALGAGCSIFNEFNLLRRIYALCSREGILASKLMHYPKVFEQVPGILMPSTYEVAIGALHCLYDARNDLGYVLIDLEGLQRLLALAPKGRSTMQAPYIPPRIWTYQVTRLRECLEDFLAHRAQIEACFAFCLEGYIRRYDSLAAVFADDAPKRPGPFSINSLKNRYCNYLGPFVDTLERFGIRGVLERWVEPKAKEGLIVRHLSVYLHLVGYAGLMYIGNFTLQRKEELNALRVDCLMWENDEKLGRVPIICGETTKTDPDSDARWVASPSVAVAVDALTAITRLQMPCVEAHPKTRPTAADIADPYLYTVNGEPWASSIPSAYSVRAGLCAIGEQLKYFPKLFDLEQLRITAEDLRIALQMTPNLPKDQYAIGRIWPLAWHQYRRTGAVNMFASGELSDSTMQQLLKHVSRLQSLYYGRGFTRLHLNEKVGATVIKAMYESMARALQTVMSERFVSPHSPERKEALVVNVIGVKDVKTLAQYAKRGTVSWRQNRLGGCMKAGACEYGGVESVARCGGGDGDAPCADVLFDTELEPQVREDIRVIDQQMMCLPADSPRYMALAGERRAFENYLHAIKPH